MSKLITGLKHSSANGFRLFLIVAIVVAVQAPSAFARGADVTPGIAPIQSHPNGRTYGEWAAEWWKWAFGVPASVNPGLMAGEVDCGVMQGAFLDGPKKGRVWFLVGAFGGGQVFRSCDIPTGTAIFFPLINAFFGAFLNDPPGQRTEEFLREQVDCEANTLFAQIDGVEVKNPFQYLTQGPLFDVQLPEDNIAGLSSDDAPELLLSPSAQQGYYLFLRPLPPGEHTIHWMAQWMCFGRSFSENVTYQLNVVPPNTRVPSGIGIGRVP